jgi:hypothetical protein
MRLHEVMIGSIEQLCCFTPAFTVVNSVKTMYNDLPFV